jgi:hypothetical protein
MPIRIGMEVTTTIVEESIAIGITVTGAGTIINSRDFCLKTSNHNTERSQRSQRQKK